MQTLTTPPPPLAPEEIYAVQRLASVGMTLEDTVTYQYVHDDSDGAQAVPLVRSDFDNNMVFAYAGLDGQLQTYAKARKEVHYEVKRLRVPAGDRKYINPEGTPSRIFITPPALKIYNADAPELETLFITEGQMKALAMSHYGAIALGISGIWNFKDGNALKGDLESYIKRVKPRRVCLLFDADARSVTRRKVEDGADLAERLRQFYSAVVSFRELAQALRTDTWDGPEIYYAQVHKDSAYKGVDDLIAALPDADARRALMRSLSALDPKAKQFEIKNLTADGLVKLKTFFFLHKAQMFYDEYSEIIANEEFVWQGGRYQAEPDGLVRERAHPHAVAFIRVGANYYKSIYGTNAYGLPIRTLKPWMKGEITADYGNKFINQVAKYDDFCNIPHLPRGEYQPVVETQVGALTYRHYNRYNPLPHVPHAGVWPTIENYLKHIFKEQYEMGLDWIQILYTTPTQKLPILCLVSEEKGTGKTMFLSLMSMIFGGNATIVGNEDFSGDFNSHFVDKLVVGIDEGLIEKQAVMETIKSMVTRTTIGLHSKGKDKSEVDCMLHFVLTSNNVDNFLRIDAQENRFWVRQVSRFQGEEIPEDEMKTQLREEIPAFLHHLLQRTISMPKVTRFWFEYQAYKTEALAAVVAQSRSMIDKALDTTIERIAIERGQSIYHITVGEMMAELKKDTGVLFGQQPVAKALQKRFSVDRNSTYRQIPISWDKRDGIAYPFMWEKKGGRWYTVDIRNWYTDAEEEGIMKMLPPMAQQLYPKDIVEEKQLSAFSDETVPF